MVSTQRSQHRAKPVIDRPFPRSKPIDAPRKLRPCTVEAYALGCTCSMRPLYLGSSYRHVINRNPLCPLHGNAT
jgi:hypothetical protein